MRDIILMLPIYMYILLDLSYKGIDIYEVDLRMVSFIAFVVVYALFRKVIR
jgi:hypothetical protein